MNRDFKGIWIPREIWEIFKRQSILERLLNYYFLDSALDISDWKILVEKGFAEERKNPPEHIANFLKTKKPQIINLEESRLPRCSWCGSQTFRLQHHHYPIPRSEGGLDIIPICASCHDEYHFLLEHNYALTDKTLQLFKNAEEENNE